jgi:hypothetical protein
MITDQWLERAIKHPIREEVQSNGRIRRWVKTEELAGRHLRVVLALHNAFFDRRFVP